MAITSYMYFNCVAVIKNRIQSLNKFRYHHSWEKTFEVSGSFGAADALNKLSSGETVKL